jgi:hypothetical protein
MQGVSRSATQAQDLVVTCEVRAPRAHSDADAPLVVRARARLRRLDGRSGRRPRPLVDTLSAWSPSLLCHSSPQPLIQSQQRRTCRKARNSQPRSLGGWCCPSAHAATAAAEPKACAVPGEAAASFHTRTVLSRRCPATRSAAKPAAAALPSQSARDLPAGGKEGAQGHLSIHIQTSKPACGRMPLLDARSSTTRCS